MDTIIIQEASIPIKLLRYECYLHNLNEFPEYITTTFIRLNYDYKLYNITPSDYFYFRDKKFIIIQSDISLDNVNIYAECVKHDTPVPNIFTQSKHPLTKIFL